MNENIPKFMNFKRLISNYGNHIRPPYSKVDLIPILITIFLAITPPSLIIASQKAQNNAKLPVLNPIVFINPQTLEVVQNTNNPMVNVQLTAPWPITASHTHQSQVAGDHTEKTTESIVEKALPSKVPVATSLPSKNPTPVSVDVIVLAEDQLFTQNVVTISPITSNPLITMYTFSNTNAGSKTLYARFISTLGESRVYNKSIQLVSESTPTILPTTLPTLPPDNTNITAPSPNDLPCPESAHTNSKFHTLWDPILKCHYDHEHGENPFAPEVTNVFPNFNLLSLLGGVQVGHTNHSSPIENVHGGTGKHGGMKWQTDATAPQGCQVGFEDGEIAIDAYAIQYHSFGRQDIEFESRQHSSIGLLRQCKSDNPNDKGYIYVGQLQEYGQRVMPYQGYLLPYPNNFTPSWDTPRGQYLTTECFGNDTTIDGKFIDCRPTYDDRNNNQSLWTSKITGRGERPSGSGLFTLLFRLRDAYQRIDINDLVHPFTWRFVCGGETYNPAGCRYNNSTTTIHEVMGRIPASWDNMPNFDNDPRLGRITGEGFVTRYGDLNTSCTVAVGLDCQPIKLLNAFVGRYSSELSAEKVSNPTPLNTPERDIYFCNGVMCNETATQARPSGWIGQNN